MDPICLGVDLGTTNSCIASYYSADKVEVCENIEGERTTPSFVSVINNDCFVGRQAVKQMDKSPETTFYCAKRLIGRKYNDPTIRDDLNTFSFKVVEKDGEPVMPFNGIKSGEAFDLTPEHISSIVLQYLYNSANVKFKNQFSKAVITVPANFNDYQRRATIEAGKIAGFDVIDVLSEPTAAAICYAYGPPRRMEKETVMVFDFGGGTLDVSILKINSFNFTVRATAGNPHLGGSDIDNALVKDMVNYIRDNAQINLDSPDLSTYKLQLRQSCEQAKIALTSSDTTMINFLPPGSDIMIRRVINRASLERMCEDLKPRLLKPMEIALKSAEVGREAISNVIMVGGSSRLPFVQKWIEEFIGKKPIIGEIDEGIAKGAAIYGALKTKERKKGDTDHITVTDVTPMAIGIGINGKRVHHLIPRNTPIPVKSIKAQFKGNRPRKDEDNNPIVKVKIFEGDSRLQRECHLVQECDITTVHYDRKGFPIVDIRMEVTSSEIRMNITNNEEVIKIDTKKDAHSQEEIDLIKKQVTELTELAEMSDDDEEVDPVREYNMFLTANRIKLKKQVSKKNAKLFDNLFKDHRNWCKKNEDASKEEVEGMKESFLKAVEDWTYT